DHLAANGLRTGKTDGKTTFLGSEQRQVGGADLPLRIMGLLLDPACEALVVNCTVAELERCGIPHARFDMALVPAGADVSSAIRDLIATHVKDVVEMGSGGEFK